MKQEGAAPRTLVVAGKRDAGAPDNDGLPQFRLYHQIVSPRILDRTE